MRDLQNMLFDIAPDYVKYSDRFTRHETVDDKSRGQLERYLRWLGLSIAEIYEDIYGMPLVLSLDFMPETWVRYWYDFFGEEYREDLSDAERRKWLLDLLSKVKAIGTIPGIIQRIESWTGWTVQISRTYSHIFKSNGSLTLDYIDHPDQITNKGTWLDEVHYILGSVYGLKAIRIHVWTAGDVDYDEKIAAMDTRLQNTWLPTGVTYIWVRET